MSEPILIAGIEISQGTCQKIKYQVGCGGLRPPHPTIGIFFISRSLISAARRLLIMDMLGDITFQHYKLRAVFMIYRP